MRLGHLALIFLIILAAATLRLANLGLDSFGHDEAIRANRTHHGPVADGRWIPPLQYGLLRVTQTTLGRNETVLRLPFALAGIVCVVLLYAFARAHLDAGAALLIAALAACHPVLVMYSRSVKVFSFEAMVCALLMLVGLDAYRRAGPAALIRFTLCALLGIGLTFTGSLVAAAWVPVLAGAYLFGKKRTGRTAWTFAASSFLLLAAAIACYVWLSGASTTQQMKGYYDTQEITWPTAYTLPGLALWLALAAKGAAMYILGVTQDWPPLSWCAGAFQVLAATLAMGVLWKRCRPACIAAFILAVEVALAGAFRIWPLGRLRTVTFLVPIASIIIGCGMWQFVRRVGWSPAAAGFVGLCIGLPLLNAAKTTIFHPVVSEHLRPVIEHVRASIQSGDALFVYYGASDAFEYYADIGETLRQPDNLGPPRFISLEWGGVQLPVQVEPVSDREDQPAFERRFGDWAAKHDRVWFLFAHDWKNEHAKWSAHVQSEYNLMDRIETHNASAYLVVSKDAVVATKTKRLR